MKPLCFVFGTRPEIIKFSPLIYECQKRKVPFFVIHTGQHYDTLLDQVFFEELSLPQPEYSLNMGDLSLPYPEKLGAMITGIERVLRERTPTAVVVQGDTTSALAGALAAKRACFPVAHVEAGLRSRDYAMTEEWNRIMIDKVADWYFAPTKEWAAQLVAESVDEARIYTVGNSVVDAVKAHSVLSETRAAKLLNQYGLTDKQYILATVHRAENADSRERLEGILKGITQVAEEHHLPVLLPLHPRTKHKYEEFGLTVSSSIQIIEPLGYLEFLPLEAHARLIITDSGGLQEEASILRVPCVTVRDSTERPETVEAAMNMLAGAEASTITQAARTMLSRDIQWIDLYGDGKTGERIVSILTKT